MDDFIPVSQPRCDGNERKYLNDCIDTGWLSSEGPYVARFETAFAARVGRKHGIAVCNGSAALDACVAALVLGPGDEVIMPAFTIISCAASIVRCGARPVLVDCDSALWNMRAEGVEAAITPRTKAIMVVHIYGLPVDMDPLLDVARRHNLRIIEDAAEMHGQTYCGRPCGSFGDLSAFSFYSNKHVTTGEGGMIVTDSEALAERCRSLRNLCFDPRRRFVHDELGWNFRMSNLQAAVGLAQLESLDATVARKREIGRLYTQSLSGVDALQLPVPSTSFAENIYWVYGVVLKEDVPFGAAEAMKKLAALGIGTRPFFWPMHRQPVFQRMGLFHGDSHPTAERLGERGFYLPSGTGLADEQVIRAAAAMRKVVS